MKYFVRMYTIQNTNIVNSHEKLCKECHYIDVNYILNNNSAGLEKVQNVVKKCSQQVIVY